MFFCSKGIIALDIDGTITSETYALDQRVIETLEFYAKEGWLFIFITGRSFQWGFRTLEPLPFPFALAVQNGALLLDMPARKILLRKYLTKEILPKMESICQKVNNDFVIYSGLENGDWCYYRPVNFSPSLLSYVLRRTDYLHENWQDLQTFDQLPVSQFSSLKYFAKEDQARTLSLLIEQELRLHAPLIRDPFDPDYFVIQATHAEATKGGILEDFIRLTGITGPVIAAGDDYNDLSMLQRADIKVVMANAPPELLAIADVLAPPANQQGIIPGLTKAIQLAS